jgi:molybdopterin synthase sulfur carrier subunit
MCYKWAMTEESDPPEIEQLPVLVTATQGIMSKPLTILYFAWLRERTGSTQEELLLPGGVETVGDLIDYLSARNPRHATAFRNHKTIRYAVNQEFADLSSSIRPGDEVAFFPPVTGG